MEKENRIYLEMYNRNNSFNVTYGAELSMPCTDADIDDVKQKLRCHVGEEPVVDYNEFSLVPELDDVQISGSLLEYNALAKRLGSLEESEVLTYRALVAKAISEGSYKRDLKDLINMTYGLDEIIVATDISDDRHLGGLVIESGMNETVNALSDDAVKLLDEWLVGAMQRKEDNGFYYHGNYFALCGYKPQEVYDGVNLPDELKPDHAEFGFTDNNGIVTPIPYLNTLIPRGEEDKELLKQIEDKWLTMNAGQQIQYKAVLEAEQPSALKDCLYLMGCLNFYEFSYYSDSADGFAKEFLLYHLPKGFDGELLQRMSLHELGTDILRQIGARVTQYGILSEPDYPLYRVRICTDQVAESSNTYDLIEVCGEKAIFSNWRFAGNEVPEGHYRYDIRTDSEGNFCTIEPFVVVDYGGTIITKEPIGLGEEGCFVLNEDDSPNFLGEQITLDEFAKTDFTEDEGMEMQL
jgi:hypothetical protein